MPDDLASAHAFYETMSPTLLSKQPLQPPVNRYKTQASYSALYQHASSVLNEARNWRWSWWQAWGVLAEYFLPRRYNWFVTANRNNRGAPLNQSIIDTTPVQALRTCSAGLWSGLTSPLRPWFEFDSETPDGMDLDSESEQWMARLQNATYAMFDGSNFYDTMAQAFEDVSVFGSAPVIAYPDAIDGIRFYLPCAGEYFLIAGARLTVDSLAREFTYTVQQIVEMFGLDNCPAEVQSLWSQGGGSRQKEFVISYLIEPNTAMPGPDGRPVDVLPGKFAYREVYWLRGREASKPLSLKGFDTKPFAVARGPTTSNEAYGRSICMDVLGDNKQVQRETFRKAEFLEKGVRPPMGANVELKNEPSSIKPGDVTYVSSDGQKKGFWPLFEVNPSWLQFITADIKDVAQRIKDGLYVTLFMAITQMAGVQPRNELELTKRDLERLQELGPFISKFEREFAGPIIELVVRRILDLRIMGPMPKMLAKYGIKIRYKSIMRMAQEAAEAVSMKDFFQTSGAISAAAKAAGVPDPLRTVKLDLALKRYSRLVNMSPDLFYTDDEVKAHDAIRMQEQKSAQAATQGPDMINAGVNAAKTLSETQLPSGGSALGALMGGGGQ